MPTVCTCANEKTADTQQKAEARRSHVNWRAVRQRWRPHLVIVFAWKMRNISYESYFLTSIARIRVRFGTREPRQSGHPFTRTKPRLSSTRLAGDLRNGSVRFCTRELLPHSGSSQVQKRSRGVEKTPASGLGGWWQVVLVNRAPPRDAKRTLLCCSLYR